MAPRCSRRLMTCPPASFRSIHSQSPAIGAAADARPPRWETRSRSPAITTASDARKPMTRKAKPNPSNGLSDAVSPLRALRMPCQTTASRTHAAKRGRRPAGSQERNTTMTATSVTEHHAPTGCAHDTVGHDSAGQDAFSTDITGLPGSVPTPTVELSDGAVYDLRVAPVTKQIGDATVRMLAYNGSDPRTHAPRPAGHRGGGERRQRQRPGDHRALARAAAGQPVRRHPPHPGPHRDRAAPSATGSPSPTPACTGTTRTSGRTTARKWASTAPSSSNPPTPTTGHR